MNRYRYLLFRVPRFLKQVFYRHYNRFWLSMIGIKYGKNLQVYNKVYVCGFGQVKIGDDFKYFSDDSFNPIHRNIRGAFYLGNSNACIEIGDRVGISASCLWADNRISIGNDVNIGGDTLIMDNDAHPINYLSRRRFHDVQCHPSIPAIPVVIEDDVWIGARCIILKGVHIGARSIIAAGSVVTKNIPADCVAGGNPCRIIRYNNMPQ
ncbi:Hexapeptide repeat of succinyl-transferase [Prevotella sp. ne3005]|uniref:acyltransferase n=1 Tax=Prevotella sp. ne3005 TaxID=1761887 RepID=UPI0008BDED9A|nr:acyltransferase [Prevotella sp. ne3005]SEM55731.1 Hexapeptide repeat of succinyl-transferase [Prevotella sp. ne3005]